MLTQGRRIKRIDFPSYKDQKTTWNGGVLRISCYRRIEKNTHTRFTVVVSKKNYQTISGRNRFKRRVFSVISGLLGDFDQTIFDRFVILPTKKVEDITFSEIQNDIRSLISASI